MHQPEEKYQVLIAKDLAQEITSSEQAELMEWVNQHPENRAFYDQYRKNWELTGQSDPGFSPDVDAAWSRMKARIASNVPAAAKETKVVSMFPSYLLRIAASVLLITGIGFLAYRYLKAPETVSVTASADHFLHLLPDSSRVWLKKGSSVAYAEGFSENKRTVNLTGEGFFEVKRNEKKAFIVKGTGTEVEVLGTSFVVHTGTGIDKEYVVVATGKVKFTERGKKENSVTLTAGDKAIFKAGSQIEKKTRTNANATAWKDNKLSFDNTSLKDVIGDLELYFGKKIEVSDPALYQCRFTGSFDAPDLDAVLLIVSMSVNSSLEKKQDHYLLRGSGCL